MSPEAIELNYIEGNSPCHLQNLFVEKPKSLYIRALSVSSMLRVGRRDYKKMLRELEEATTFSIFKKEML